MQMRMLAKLISMLAAALVCSTAAGAPRDLVRAELLSNVKTVKAGEPFEVGILLKIKPDWHVYWINPGDAGLPTRVKFDLPAGWAAGELEYPIPQRIELPGGVVNYGYEDEVMLLARLTPPRDFNGASAVDLAADVSWLVCEKVCIPGKQHVKLSLPVTGDRIAANRELFDQWRKRLPVPAEKLSGVGVDAGPLDLSSGTGSTEIIATLKMSDPAIPKAVGGLELTIGAPQAVAHGTRYAVQARILPGERVTAEKVEVLVGPYQVTIPIIGAASPATAPSAENDSEVQNS
jgi:thiol:disulfide interchange protein DsbD